VGGCGARRLTGYRGRASAALPDWATISQLGYLLKLLRCAFWAAFRMTCYRLLPFGRREFELFFHMLSAALRKKIWQPRASAGHLFSERSALTQTPRTGNAKRNLIPVTYLLLRTMTSFTVTVNTALFNTGSVLTVDGSSRQRVRTLKSGLRQTVSAGNGYNGRGLSISLQSLVLGHIWVSEYN